EEYGSKVREIIERSAGEERDQSTNPAHRAEKQLRVWTRITDNLSAAGYAAAILAKTFRLTPAQAKLACVIARGASPEIAAGELKISRETARNQLKSVFAKTDTHRQSELVALLLQVE